jgi:hypothetical protein
MSKYFILLSSCLLIAFAGGCGDKAEIDCIRFPEFVISFIDSEGRDLVEGLPVIKDPCTEYVPSDLFQLKLFVNDEEEVLSTPRRVIKISNQRTYAALEFSLDSPLMTYTSDPSDTLVYMLRYEVVCPYIFANKKVHTLEGELRRTVGYQTFRRFWFDGVECSPANGQLPGKSFTFQVNR